MNKTRELITKLKEDMEKQNIEDGLLIKQTVEQLLNIVDDLSCAIDILSVSNRQLKEKISEIDEDLADIENVVYEDEYNEITEGCEEEHCNCCEIMCVHCENTFELPVNSDSDGDLTEYSDIKCPHCQKQISISSSDLYHDINMDLNGGCYDRNKNCECCNNKCSSHLALDDDNESTEESDTNSK